MLAQVNQQRFHRCGVLRGPFLDAQHVLPAVDIHAHRADHVMVAELLPIEVDHQQVHLFPAALEQFAELRGAGFDGLAAHRRLRHADGRRHLRRLSDGKKVPLLRKPLGGTPIGDRPP